VSIFESIGWFEGPGETPTFDPGEAGVCPLCDKVIGTQPRLCRSLMVNGRRSYFFSYHEACKDTVRLKDIEHQVVDELFTIEDNTALAANEGQRP
jgi:hypothetical protein